MMDTSPEYIKMCEKAEELQNNHKPSDGDFYICFDDGIRTIGELTVAFEKLLYPEDVEIYGYDPKIWLPRQDQLQGMIDYEDCGMLISMFWNWLDENNPPCISMEQLWLAFVMKEKYGKQWDGENWIKVSA